MHRTVGTVLLALLLSVPLALAALPGPSSTDALVVSNLNARLTGYATPLVVLQPGQALVHVNPDLSRHDVVAYEDDSPVPQPWCGLATTLTGGCPVFWSPEVDQAQTAAVQGLDQVEPGRPYTFYCTLHPGMQGQLLVVEA